MRGAWSVQLGKARNPYFFEAIAHYMYADDTALHMAAAAHSAEITQALLTKGADCFAKNRRGAQPLHFAADANAGNPGSASRHHRVPDPSRRRSQRNGQERCHAVAPRRSHAIRNGGRSLAGRRCGAARAETETARPPLHLAVQNTGASHSGTPQAIDQRRLAIDLLLRAGATPDDRDENGKAVYDAARPTRFARCFEAFAEGRLPV